MVRPAARPFEVSPPPRDGRVFARVSAARLVMALVAMAVLAWSAWSAWRPGVARADADTLDATPPRDVGVVVQPSAVKLAPAPADFQRIEGGWLTIEFPASVR